MEEDLMPPDNTRNESDRKFIAAVRREQEMRRRGYRERALKMFPPVCARCGRAFEGKRLRELTVHHKDHNHDHNPPDGSNWELLCIYCHENEHSRYLTAEWSEAPAVEAPRMPVSTYQPFAGLDALIKHKK